eukprot:7380297-Prymnesium_polylepis.6
MACATASELRPKRFREVTQRRGAGFLLARCAAAHRARHRGRVDGGLTELRAAIRPPGLIAAEAEHLGWPMRIAGDNLVDRVALPEGGVAWGCANQVEKTLRRALLGCGPPGRRRLTAAITHLSVTVANALPVQALLTHGPLRALDGLDELSERRGWQPDGDCMNPKERQREQLGGAWSLLWVLPQHRPHGCVEAGAEARRDRVEQLLHPRLRPNRIVRGRRT